MKTKLFTLLMTLIIIGIVFPAFAGTPDKNKGDKSTTEPVKSEIYNGDCPPSYPPPTPWTATVIIVDTTETCAAQGCNLLFLAFPASDHCVAQSAVPVGYAQYHQGSFSFPITIPSTDIPCVIIRITDDPVGSCNAPFNKNECCICQPSPTCTLRICQ